MQTTILYRTVWFVRSTSMDTLEPLHMRLIFVIRMMRFQDRARSAVQHLIRPSSILVTEICAKVQTLEHVSKFEFLFDATP